MFFQNIFSPSNIDYSQGKLLNPNPPKLNSGRLSDFVDKSNPYSKINWNDYSNSMQYGITNYNPSNYAREITVPHWYGNPTTEQVIDKNLAFSSVMQSPVFSSYFNAQSPDRQDYIKNNIDKLDLSNFNNTNLQVSQGLFENKNTWTPQNKLDALKSGVGVISSLANLYFANKQQNLARREYENTKALQQANYRNYARSYNSNTRDIMSGRGTTLMGTGARMQINNTLKRRLVREDY